MEKEWSEYSTRINACGNEKDRRETCEKNSRLEHDKADVNDDL